MFKLNNISYQTFVQIGQTRFPGLVYIIYRKYIYWCAKSAKALNTILSRNKDKRYTRMTEFMFNLDLMRIFCRKKTRSTVKSVRGSSFARVILPPWLGGWYKSLVVVNFKWNIFPLMGACLSHEAEEIFDYCENSLLLEIPWLSNYTTQVFT